MTSTHPAAESYAGWAFDVLTSPGTALTKKSIDKAFSPNHEHPPFAKFVMGGAQSVMKRLGFARLDGARAGVAFLCALLCAVMSLVLLETYGGAAAIIGPVLLLSLPRFVFHSQVATLDVPVAAMVFLTASAFFWSLRSKKRALLCGILFGFALLTKLNAPFAAIPATLYILLQRGHEIRLRRDTQPGVALPDIPLVLWSMAIVGPIVFLLGWPWLWFDTFPRIGAYFGFHLKHYPIFLFYEGVIFSKPFAPWHMPFTMAAACIPAPIIVLGLLGAADGVRQLARMVFRPRRLTTSEAFTGYIFLQAAFAISIVAFLNVPKYGGEKLFMPFFPFFVVLAVRGLQIVARSASRVFGTRRLATLTLLVGIAASVPGFLGSYATRGGYGLSYYSAAFGGLRGAVARGYERTYYDIADKPLARWLDENAQGKKVHFEPNHKEYARTYRWLKRDGKINKVLLTKKRKDADLIVLTHERRWKNYPALRERLRSSQVVYEKQIDGVPLYTVYEKTK